MSVRAEERQRAWVPPVPPMRIFFKNIEIVLSANPTLLSRLRQMIFTGAGYRWSQGQKQERSMGTVMVRCPQTGRDIPTGLVTDRKSFEVMPVFFARVYCPICRIEHEWFAKEAWVRETEPRPHGDALV
jgi:hypothetical protein